MTPMSKIVDGVLNVRHLSVHEEHVVVDIVELIIKIRNDLTGEGHDAGPDTIAWHLEHHHQCRVSVSTIARTLTRHQLVTPEPNKRPKSSYIRFQAEQPNETWQSDFTHYRLANGVDTEILTWLDDHELRPS